MPLFDSKTMPFSRLAQRLPPAFSENCDLAEVDAQFLRLPVRLASIGSKIRNAL